MKTIEEKAWEYSDSRRKDADLTDVATAFHDGYIQGATEAPQSQWRSVEDGYPMHDDDVLVMYNERGSNRIAYGVASHCDDTWFTNDDDIIRDNIFAWLPIPKYEPKGGEQ
ncbi:MAG: hypothetical protein NC548_63180 [Lachnospiraceae bacterium]|nr:hypothetical protein [Lachnospiraceae bacterium]